MSEAAALLEPSWRERIGDVLDGPALRELWARLKADRAAGAVIHPPLDDIFNAFAYTPFDDVRVVILGQDPYHGPGQAHGLSFSVRPGVRIPPSLANIFKEQAADLGLPKPDHGCLTPWATQGVLLLNAVLTVEEGKANAHQGQGWEAFTDAAISELSRQRQGIVFLLWGAYAQKKLRLIDAARHCVLTGVHPSPLSAHRGFLGCGHFSAANRYLESRGDAPIHWGLPPVSQLAHTGAFRLSSGH